MRKTDYKDGLERLLARESVGRILRRFMPPPQVARRPLDVRNAYRLWAPTYESETVTSLLDEELAHGMLAGLPQAHLLDAGCGVGRRIRHIPDAVGIDLSPEMLASGGVRNVVPGDIRAMPFASGQFDMVWCRLVIGHLPDPFPAYRELSRVCMPGGHVFVTDFHPDAVLAGHRRTFNTQAGVFHDIEHYVHTNHAVLAAKAGLTLIESRCAAVQASVRDFYVHGVGRKAYLRDFGLKLVSAYLFRRAEHPPS